MFECLTLFSVKFILPSYIKAVGINKMYYSEVTGLDRIPLCEEPLTPNSEIVYLSPNEFAVKFGCEYSENLKTPTSLKGSHILAEQMSDLTEEQVLERISNPLKYLTICKLDNPVGYSILTTETIPANTVIGFFHGIVKKSAPGKLDPYSMHYVDDLLIDPENTGGILRFMPHLPYHRQAETNTFKDKFIKNYKKTKHIDLESPAGKELLQNNGIDLDTFVESMMTQYDSFSEFLFANEHLKEEIATANVALTNFVIKDKIYHVAYTTRDIPAYSVVGFSYGSTYFTHENAPSPCLLYPNGKYLEPRLYH